LPQSGAGADSTATDSCLNGNDESSDCVASHVASRDYVPRKEIKIFGNANFTAANGVTGGSGTEVDPYLIENWSIQPNTGHGIFISGASASFIIRNVSVHDGKYSASGIRLSRVENGAIENCTVENNSVNIHISTCSKIRIANNDIVSQYSKNNNYVKGITVYSNYPLISYDIVITGNRVGGCRYPIECQSSTVTVTDNEVFDASTGITISESECLVSGNRISSSQTGISSGVIKKSKILGNEIQASFCGIRVSYADDVNIEGNSIQTCREWGIAIESSTNLNVSRCHLSNMSVDGILVESSSYTAIDNCSLISCGIAVREQYDTISVSDTNVNGKPVYYLKWVRDGTVPADAGQIFIVGCTNLTVRDFHCQAVPAPIFIHNSRDIRIDSAHFSKADYGAYVSWSKNVSLNNSWIMNTGICLYFWCSQATVANSSLISQGGGNDLCLEEVSTVDVVNCSLNQSRVTITSTKAACRIYWLASVFLSDAESGRRIPGGTVRIENHTRVEVFNGSADSRGCILNIPLLEGTLLNESKILSNQYMIYASAPFYMGNRTTDWLLVGRSFSIGLELVELTRPWSWLDALPAYWTTSDPLPLHFSAGDNGSGLDYVELYANTGGGWEPFSNASGVSRFRESPILFDNFTVETDYGFYCVAYDNSTHVQEPPYNLVVTKLDHTAPNFTITPADGTDDAAINASVEIAFSEAVNLSSIKIEIAPGRWTTRWSPDGLTLTFNPYGELDHTTTYTVKVLSGVDLAGNHLVPRSSSFTTIKRPEPDISQPTTVGIHPPSDSVLAPGPVVITIDFSEPMNWTSVSGALKVNGRPAPAGSGNGTGYSFTLNAEVGEYYTLILDTTASDVAGNGLQSTFITAFTCSVPGVPLGSISGQVVAENGAGLSSVNVTVGRRQLVTDVNGLFNASRLAAGDYLLTASGYPGYFPYDSSFSLSPGENLTVTIVLRAMNGTLGGYIRIGDGQPVAGASVTILSGGERVARVLSDRTGRFTVVVRPGTYTLKVTAEGFDDVVLEDREVLPGQAVETELIVLAYRANEPASSVIPLALISILGLAAMALFIQGIYGKISNKTVSRK